MEIKKIDLNNPVQQPVVSPKTNNRPKIVGFVLIILFGLGLGVFAKKNTALSSVLPGGSPVMSTTAPADGLKEGDVIGVNDDATFKDEVRGVLDKGGFNGEGSHKLLRPGGASQTVYLTSSVVDLDEFVGHEVTVKGQTFSGQKVGWLMDVGRVKVEKLNAPLPE